MMMFALRTDFLGIKTAKRRSLFSKLFFILLFSLIFIFVAGNSENPDIFSSKYFYEQGILSKEAFLVDYLQLLSIRLSLSFYQFRLIIYIIGFAFLLFGIIFSCENKIGFLMLYILFPMMIDATQLFNFVSMSIIFFAFSVFYKEKSFNKIIVLLFIIVSAGFHTVSIFYVIFLFGHSFRSRRAVVNFAVISLAISLIVILFRNQIIVVASKTLSTFFTDERITRYLSNSGNFGFLFFWGIHISLVALVYLKAKNTPKSKLISLTLKMLVLSMILLPLYGIDSNFFRITRNLLPFVFASVLIPGRFKIVDRRIVFSLVIVLTVWFGYQILLFDYDSIFLNFFRHNFIIWGN